MKSLIKFFFCLLFVTNNIFPQDSIRTIHGYTYGKYSGDWYTVNENGKADLIDLRHLIVRLISNAEIKKFDNTKYNLPSLKITRDKFVDSYYVLEIPISFNPFEYAELLENTDEFETILFNVFAQIK